MYRFDVEVQFTLNSMRNREASGLCGVVLEMLKAGRQPCLNSLIVIFSDILSGNGCWYQLLKERKIS